MDEPDYSVCFNCLRQILREEWNANDGVCDWCAEKFAPAVDGDTSKRVKD